MRFWCSHIRFSWEKKTVFSYALLSGGPAIIPCHETVVLYIQHATSEGSDATAHLATAQLAICKHLLF